MQHGGAIKIDATINKVDATQYKIRIHFKVKSGWHINSHTPNQKQLIATTIIPVNEKVWQLNEINYPHAELVKTKFGHEPLSLYQGALQFLPTLLQNLDLNLSKLKLI